MGKLSNDDEIIIRRMNGEAEAPAVARIMAETEPWITLGSTYERIHRNILDTNSEVYVAVAGEQVVGVVRLCIPIPLVKGYIASLAVAKDFRNRGIGTKLMAFAEERIFRESPNVFLCVSSFNPSAQRFYRRLGYELIGPIRDLIVPGHDEILHRKTRGPWSTFKPAS